MPPSMPFWPEPTVHTMRAASGDQAAQNMSLKEPGVSSRRYPLPSTFMIAGRSLSAGRPFASRRRVPSGEKTAPSAPIVGVTARSPVPSAFATSMPSPVPYIEAFVSYRLKTIRPVRPRSAAVRERDGEGDEAAALAAGTDAGSGDAGPALGAGATGG